MFHFVEELLKGIDEAEDLLLNHLVQGQLNDKGSYRIKLSSDHIGDSEREELNPVDPTFLGTDIPIETSKPSDAK